MYTFFLGWGVDRANYYLQPSIRPQIYRGFEQKNFSKTAKLILMLDIGNYVFLPSEIVSSKPLGDERTYIAGKM